jgi:hypothetical protein
VGYKELKLRVSVKLKLNILKMSVGIVIVAKLNAHTKTRVNPRITDAIRRNIQPNIPCEGAVSTDEVAEARILLPSSVTWETVSLSVTSLERFSIVSSIVVKRQTAVLFASKVLQDLVRIVGLAIGSLNVG